MWLMIGATVLNIVGNVMLIPSLGAIGAATATGIANVAVTLACLLRLSRTGRLRFSITWLRDIVLASSLCTALALLTTSFGSMSLSLALTTVLAAYLVYGLCICLTCTVEDELAQQARFIGRNVRFIGFAPCARELSFDERPGLDSRPARYRGLEASFADPSLPRPPYG